MKLLLTRDVLLPESTLGVLTVDDKLFGFTCEDQDRHLDVATMTLSEIKARKVSAETAIPLGTYTVKRTWSKRYGRTMIQVLRVPGFEGIRLHPGNVEADTAGCILPGLHRAVSDQAGSVVKSGAACAWLEEQVRLCEERAEAVTIEIRRAA